MKQSRSTPCLVAGVAFLLALYPSVLSYLQEGSSSCFRSFSADATYYLAVAKNPSWNPVFSFDTIHPTNGFHPLWQTYLKACYSSSPALSGNQPAQLLLAYWTGAICIAVAAALLSVFVLRLTRSPSLAVIAVVPGLLYFPVALASQRFGSLWSYVNGMESAFSLLLFAILVALIVKCRLYDSGTPLLAYLPVGILASGLVLSRLDDVFIVPALCAPLLLSSIPLRKKLARWSVLAGLPALIILLYCAFNIAYAGTPLPVSGQIKGNLGWGSNISRLCNAFFPVGELWGNNWGWWRALTWRSLHNVVPAAASVAFLFSARRRTGSCSSLPAHSVRLLCALSLYVIAKAAYNFVFVGAWHQGHWYYPISFCVASIPVALYLSRARDILKMDCTTRLPLRRPVARLLLVAALLMALIGLCLFLIHVAALGATGSASPLIGNYSMMKIAVMGVALVVMIGLVIAAASILRHKITEIPIPVGFAATVLVILFSANAMMAEKVDVKYRQHDYQFWLNRDTTTAQIRDRYEDVGILSFDDGIVAYSLDMPVMSGLGFALDHSAVKAKRAGHLLDIAYSRGFRWLTSLNYMPAIPAAVGQDVTEEISTAFWLSGENMDNWVFRIAYVQPETGCRFVEFAPKNHHTTTESAPGGSGSHGLLAGRAAMKSNH